MPEIISNEISEKTETPKIKKPNKLVSFLIFIAIVIILGLLWARYISTSGLIVKEYKVESANLPASFHGLKIVHFSDLHYLTTIKEKELKSLVAQINELNPDIVVFTGDLIDEDHNPSEEELTLLQDYLSQIKATLFKYAISGNHDYVASDINALYQNTGFKYLENVREDIYYEGATPISLYGFPSSLEGEPDYSILDEENNNFKIILIHEPDSISNISAATPNLVLAGHSHGGQVRFPIVGALYTPVGSKKYYEEHYSINNTELYISSGLGTSALRIRFFNKPSINLYRLYSTQSNPS